MKVLSLLFKFKISEKDGDPTFNFVPTKLIQMSLTLLS